MQQNRFFVIEKIQKYRKCPALVQMTIKKIYRRVETSLTKPNLPVRIGRD